MEQRWQDLANLLSFPPGMGVGMGVGDMSSHYPSHHYPHHYPQVNSLDCPNDPFELLNTVKFKATAPLSHQGQFGHPHTHPAVLHNASLADIGAPQPHYGPNLGSAVSTSMHLTNSTSETDAGVTGYKMEHDMMYYSVSVEIDVRAVVDDLE
jgi:nuclear factor erythroid 2, invertebrate